MYTVVIAVDGELQTWEREDEMGVKALVRELNEEKEGGADVLVFPCRKVNLKVSTVVELS